MTSVAELAWRQDWDAVRRSVEAGADVNAPFFGKTALQWAAYHGDNTTLAALAGAPAIEIDARDLENACTALHWAVLKSNLEAVHVLLAAHANAHAVTQDGQTPLQLAIATNAHAIADRLQDAMNMPPVKEELDGKGGARLSFIRTGDVARVHAWLAQAADTVIESRDDSDKTPLMLAAAGGHHTIVELLLERGPDVDATDAMGRTALMYAALSGHPIILDMLLGHFADMDVVDNDGASVQLLLHAQLSDKSHSASELARFQRCLATLQKEAQYRETSTAYRMKVRASILKRMEQGFDATVFKMAVHCDPSLGRWCLNHALIVDRHALSFHELEKIYGTRGVKKSPLYTLLHLPSDEAYEAQRICLDHLVMRRVLDLKWELFGQRMFIERVLMYGLFVTTMTISASLDDSNRKQPDVILSFSAVNWAVVVLFLVCGWLGAQALRPSMLWRLARYFVDGRCTAYDGLVQVTASDKRKAKWLILALTVSIAIAGCVPACWLLLSINLDDWFLPFKIVNLALLFCTALYFLSTELRELRGDTAALLDPTDKSKRVRWSSSTYLTSFVNWYRLLVYLIIAIGYVPWEIGAYGVVVPTFWHICLGTFLSLSLWVLSLEFLQVHPTTGYLLPMIQGLLVDVGNFILLYGVLQWGLSCAYLHIVQHDADATGFGIWFRAFTFAYFALFGEFRLDENFKSDDSVLLTYFRILAQVQAAIASVLLMNMLIAMMNKRVLEGLEKAKIQALASYAKCILRLEMAMSPSTQAKVMHLADVDGHECLNPLFFTPLARTEVALSPDDLVTIDTLKTHQLSWRRVLESLQSLLLEQLEPTHLFETCEQLLTTQFSLFMHKPHVNLLSAPSLLAQLVTSLATILSTVDGLRPHQVAHLEQHVWPAFHAKGAQLAATARDALNYEAATGHTAVERQLRAMDERHQRQLEAQQAVFAEQLETQRLATDAQLMAMERRLATLIQSLRPSGGAP
ncbi:hypothetical protein SDRG_13361 [Saprolegnia diclina VS20]|uniref:Uncharacterized protein n=1 Tax=Saprolegnia diclina (strain VS20) TaxID=1156394 RepID=T0PTL8_SAPDV|nr:hypothetical protein SDRG_13361 [Saprolegnia diclina VS20]EQC28849.1 hypothetical protein SDRG_13361 [Saprolegnia diclina VS20]|eukprot:XP_008617666.1 hypothetical protein SDRG_13361 [Saprolegnia diclina VS20]